jgi:hypothetical protein
MPLSQRRHVGADGPVGVMLYLCPRLTVRHVSYLSEDLSSGCLGCEAVYCCMLMNKAVGYHVEAKMYCCSPNILPSKKTRERAKACSTPQEICTSTQSRSDMSVLDTGSSGSSRSPSNSRKTSPSSGTLKVFRHAPMILEHNVVCKRKRLAH